MEALPWEIWCIALPLVAAAVAFAAGRREAPLVGFLATPLISLTAAGMVWKAVRFGEFTHAVGGWGAPLGIVLRVDGLAAVLVAMTSTVGFFISLFAYRYFASHEADGVVDALIHREQHTRHYFWPLWLTMWGSLHALFLSGDIFNLYVTLELVGISAVALVAVAGGEAVAGALRYLLVTLTGSMMYLLGVGLLYSAFGTVDLALLGARAAPGPLLWAAAALMIAGLVIKTALFPLHFWLPPAHSSAPAPASALLSALVVKSSFYLLIRLWLDVFGGRIPVSLGDALAVLGMVAIVWGSIQALLQTRLKLLVAYSTVAQIGYLFVALPMAMRGDMRAWTGLVYFMVAHACAKGAMFIAAGTFSQALAGRDSIELLRGTRRSLLMVFFAFALAGISLMGLPPSGGFIAKWLIVEAAMADGRWLIVAVVFLGGLLSAAYVFKVVQMAFVPFEASGTPEFERVPKTMQLVPLGLALVAILLGLFVEWPIALLEVGEPFGGVSSPGGAP